MRKENALGRIMATKIGGCNSKGGTIVSVATAGAASRWLRKQELIKSQLKVKK
jgi:hypothetical protein